MRFFKKIVTVVMSVVMSMSFTQSVFATEENDLENSWNTVVSISNLSAPAEVFQEEGNENNNISFNFSFEKHVGDAFETGDKIILSTNLGELFDAEWEKLSNLEIVDTASSDTIAFATITGTNITFSLTEMANGVGSVAGTLTTPSVLTAKNVGATENQPVTKKLSVENVAANIIFKERPTSSGGGDNPVTDKGAVDIDNMWKNAGSDAGYMSSWTTIEVNPIGSMDLYGSTTYPDRKYPDRKPTVHKNYVVEDVIPEKGYVDLDSVMICVALPTLATAHQDHQFNGWYSVPAGTMYAQREGTSRQRIDDGADPGHKFMTYLEQNDGETYEEFRARIVSKQLQWGVYEAEDRTQTFICNFGNLGDPDPNANNGITYKAFAGNRDFGQQVYDNNLDIFGPGGASGGNVLSYYIEFHAYYPDIVGQKQFVNHASWTSSAAGGGNNSALITINNGVGVGVVRKKEISLKLVDADAPETVIAGGKFKLQQKVNGEWQDTEVSGVTDENGMLTMGPLTSGEYKLVQTETVDGYTFDNNTYGSAGNDKVGSVSASGEFAVSNSDRFGFGTVVTNKKKAFNVEYEFVSGTKGMELPQDVLNLCPEDNNSYSFGSTVTPEQPSNATVTTQEGVWQFKGYDTDKVENITDNVKFTGTWEFVKNTYQVTYEFVSKTPDTELPEAVYELCPENGTVKHGDKVEPATPEKTKVENGKDVWIFKGWDPEKVDAVNGDVHFVGEWMLQYSITPEDQTIYTGGTSGSQENTEFPHPIYLSVNKDGDMAPLPEDITFLVDGKEYEGYPFSVKYYVKDENGEAGEEITSDENYGDYIARIVLNDDVSSDAAITTSDGRLLTFQDGTLRIRYVSNVLKASGNQMTSAIVSSKEEAEGDTMAAVLPEGTTIHLNGNDAYPYPEGTESQIALFYDELLSGNDGDREQMLLDKAKNSGFTVDGYESEFKYLDLVDMNNSNAWVSSSKGTDVFWPYPEGIDKDSNIQLLHFAGLHREYDMEGQGSLEDQVAGSTVEQIEISKTDKGVWFHIPKSGFSPFVLLTQKTYEVTYKFESGTENKELPEEVKVLLPNATQVKHGESIDPSRLEKTEVRVNDGEWIFRGWDPEKVESAENNIEFIGTWIYSPNSSPINMIPTINGKDQTLEVGEYFDPMKDITAEDKEDGNLTGKVEIVENPVPVDKDGNVTTPGTYEVIYKVADSQGASAKKIVTITVNPTITQTNNVPIIMASDQTLMVGDQLDYMLDVKAIDKEDGNLTDNVQIVEESVPVDENGCVTTPGTYQVTYLVNDSQGATAKRTVTITVYMPTEGLNILPIIMASDQTLMVGDQLDYMLDVKAIDKEDGDLTDKIQIVEKTVPVDENGCVTIPGTYEITYTVTDSQGGTAKMTVTITVQQPASSINMIPMIIAEDKTLNVGDEFDPMKDVTATDVEDGDITKDLIVVNNSVDVSTAGEYEVTYQVTDSQGAIATKTIIVTVKEDESGTDKPDDDTPVEDQPGSETPDSPDNEKPVNDPDNQQPEEDKPIKPGESGGSEEKPSAEEETGSKHSEDVETATSMNVGFYGILAMLAVLGLLGGSYFRMKHAKRR